jgi:hypothetical protein
LILKACSLTVTSRKPFFMEIPSGMEVGDGKYLVLRKTIYGLVQSARQFYAKLIKALKSCGFTGSLMDPYLWVKQSNTGIVMMAIHVDECLTFVPDEGIKEVIEDLNVQYRSGVGMVLYLIKHSRPDLANMVRELSKCMDGASIIAYKEMIRVIRFVLDTRDTCLKLKPNFDDENWN